MGERNAFLTNGGAGQTGHPDGEKNEFQLFLQSHTQKVTLNAKAKSIKLLEESIIVTSAVDKDFSGHRKH